MKQRLVIMSAGKNSRFNSEEKIFTTINGVSNLENTRRNAKKWFSEIYLAIEPRWFKRHRDVPEGISIIETVGGKGDIHSIYHALKKIPKMSSEDVVTICWGDAVFASDRPFKELLRQYDESCGTYVAVARDRYPYAWFDLDGDAVERAHFRKDDGEIPAGIHDQSLFGFKIGTLEQIEEYLSIPSEGEWKTLKYLEWLHGSRWPSARCKFITRGNVMSFNTRDELKRIVECLG